MFAIIYCIRPFQKFLKGRVALLWVIVCYVMSGLVFGIGTTFTTVHDREYVDVFNIILLICVKGDMKNDLQAL